MAVIIVPSSSPSNFPRNPTVYRIIEENDRRLAVLERATGLRSAAIGEGGIRIYDTGSLRLEDGGSILMYNLEGRLVANLGGEGGVFRFFSDSGTRVAQIGGGFSNFYDGTGELNAQIGSGRMQFLDNGEVTGLIGEFTGKYWDYTGEAWVGDTVRGLALFKEGETNPFFSVGHALAADRFDITAGYGGQNIASVDIQADHFAVRTSNGGARLSINPAGSGNVILEANDTSNNVFLGNSTSGVTIAVTGSSDLFRLFGMTTHATPANLSRDSGNAQIRVVSSAAKYKADIKPIENDHQALLSLNGISYVDKEAKESYERQLKDGPDEPPFASPEERDEWVKAGSKNAPLSPPPRYPGFLADDFVENEALRQYVWFNEEDEVEGLYYDRLTVPLLEIAKIQKSMIENQKEEIDSLKRITAHLQEQIDELNKQITVLE